MLTARKYLDMSSDALAAQRPANCIMLSVNT